MRRPSSSVSVRPRRRTLVCGQLEAELNWAFGRRTRPSTRQQRKGQQQEEGSTLTEHEQVC